MGEPVVPGGVGSVEDVDMARDDAVSGGVVCSGLKAGGVQMVPKRLRIASKRCLTSRGVGALIVTGGGVVGATGVSGRVACGIGGGGRARRGRAAIGLRTTMTSS